MEGYVFDQFLTFSFDILATCLHLLGVEKEEVIK